MKSGFFEQGKCSIANFGIRGFVLLGFVVVPSLPRFRALTTKSTKGSNLLETCFTGFMHFEFPRWQTQGSGDQRKKSATSVTSADFNSGCMLCHPRKQKRIHRFKRLRRWNPDFLNRVNVLSPTLEFRVSCFWCLWWSRLPRFRILSTKNTKGSNLLVGSKWNVFHGIHALWIPRLVNPGIRGSKKKNLRHLRILIPVSCLAWSGNKRRKESTDLKDYAEEIRIFWTG